MLTDNNNGKINYFLAGPQETDRKTSAEFIQQLKGGFKDVFRGIGCFNGAIPLQAKLDRKPFLTPQGM